MKSETNRYISPSEITENLVDQVDCIECGAIDGEAVVIIGTAYRQEVLLEGVGANELIGLDKVDEGIPSNCPLLNKLGRREVGDFIEACGSCSLSTIVLRGTVFHGAPALVN